MQLCWLDEIPDPGSRGFDPWGRGRDTVFVVRNGARVRAWVNACPHIDGAPLAWRKDAYLSAAKDAIVCYGHGAIFDIDTGRCVSGPCEGEILESVPLRVADGAISLLPTGSSPTSD